MKSLRKAIGAIALGIATTFGATAQGAEAGPAATVPATTAPAMDPALRRELGGMATTLLLALGTAMAGGSLDDFDPGPALERGIGRLANGPEVDALLDRVLGEALKGGQSGDLSPEMRAALGVALRGMLSMARREMARDVDRK